jgi:hypothetical protein
MVCGAIAAAPVRFVARMENPLTGDREPKALRPARSRTHGHCAMEYGQRAPIDRWAHNVNRRCGRDVVSRAKAPRGAGYVQVGLNLSQ